MVWPIVGPAVVGGLLNMAGGIFSNRSERKLANTAHQREVADLRAAGLNPILSATGGQGAAVPQQANVLESAGDAASSAYAAKRLNAELQNMEETTKLLRAQRTKTEWEGSSAREQFGIDHEAAVIMKGFGWDNASSARELLDKDVAGARIEEKLDTRSFKDVFGMGPDVSLGEFTRFLRRIFGGNSAGSIR